MLVRRLKRGIDVDVHVNITDELLQAVATHPGRDGLRVIAFEDGYTDLPKPAMVQRICVRRGGDPSQNALG